MTLQEPVIPAPDKGIRGQAPSGIQFATLGSTRLEYLDIPASRPGRPELLLLHEGLGAVSMWREFPAALATATGCRIVAYSRRGFGRSSPRDADYTPRFMHEEALETIPRLREALAIARPVLVGHSTGASMALIHAGAARWDVAGVVAMAPLTDVEHSNVESILQARRHYETTDWREKLGRHHDDVDGVFYGWNDTWLKPEFRAWNILEDIAGIRCPILAILGEDDEYSSVRQLAAITDHALQSPRVQLMRIVKCGHAPHRDRPELVIPAVASFVDTAARFP
jgi:pimeloyl-ACP methyl ester carboxylesterase